MLEHSLAVMGDRIRRSVEAAEPSELLDPAAEAEARDLWTAMQGMRSQKSTVYIDLVTTLLHFHWLRTAMEAHPGREEDLQAALYLADLLLHPEYRDWGAFYLTGGC